MKEEKKYGDQVAKSKRGQFLIPAGLFLGFGVGFAVNNIPAGIFIGFGAGFTAYVISLFFEK